MFIAFKTKQYGAPIGARCALFPVAINMLLLRGKIAATL